MTTGPPAVPYDILGLAVFFAAIVFSPEVSAFVAPYVVIVVAAAIGAALRLSFRHRTSRISAIGYYLRVVGLAVVLTSFVAWGVEAWISSELAPRQTLAPIALLLGLVGDDPTFWGPLVRGVFRRAVAVFDSLRSGSAGREGGNNGE